MLCAPIRCGVLWNAALLRCGGRLRLSWCGRQRPSLPVGGALPKLLRARLGCRAAGRGLANARYSEGRCWGGCLPSLSLLLATLSCLCL